MLGVGGSKQQGSNVQAETQHLWHDCGRFKERRQTVVDTSLEFRRTFQGGDVRWQNGIIEATGTRGGCLPVKKNKNNKKYILWNETSPHQIWLVSLQFQQISLFFLLNQSCGHFEWCWCLNIKIFWCLNINISWRPRAQDRHCRPEFWQFRGPLPSSSSSRMQMASDLGHKEPLTFKARVHVGPY